MVVPLSQPREVIQFTTIEQGNGVNDGYGTPAENLAINDEDGWSGTWAKAFCRDLPSWDISGARTKCYRPLPDVNFTSTTVIAVFMGRQPSHGYSIAITEVSRVGSNILVNIKATIPGPKCYVLTAVTAPFHFVAIAKTEANVVFVTETFAREC